MANARSQQELYTMYKLEAQARRPQLTDFSDGSINDIQAGAGSIIVQELQRVILDEFKKTYFSSSDGDDLEFLAVDHFGDTFERPLDQLAVGIVEFARLTAGAGDKLIPAGTIVKSAPDANGESQRFETTLSVTITGLTINASVIAFVGGPAGNSEADQVTVIESALTDPTITVNNDDAFSGGDPTETDAEYRQTIQNLIQQLRGATLSAIKATAQNVAGVVTVTCIEFIQRVIEWDEGGGTPIGSSFLIPHTYLYIADANGVANSALIQNVDDAVLFVRAGGVKITTLGATAAALNWNGQISLNPAGPNYTELSNDTAPIVEDMTIFIQNLDIGTGFNRAQARAYIISIWGPAGSDDLTDFQTTLPTGEVSGATGVKIIPGTIQTS